MDARIALPQNVNMDAMTEEEMEELDDEALEALIAKEEADLQMISKEKKVAEIVIKEKGDLLKQAQNKEKELISKLEKNNTEIQKGKAEVTFYDKKIQQAEKKLSENEERFTSLNKKIDKLDDEITSLDKKKEELYQERRDIIDKAFAPFDKSKEFSKRDSPPSSGSSTPPSKVSSGEDISSDLSDLSLSGARKDSSSDDEREKTKNSPESPKSKLFSSAMVGSLLPPASVAQPRPSSKSDLKKEPPAVSQRSQVSQVPSITVSKASVPQQNTGLLARLGFNKNKSISQPLQPSVTGNNGISSGITMQRQSSTSVR